MVDVAEALEPEFASREDAVARLVSYRISILARYLARDAGRTYQQALSLSVPQWRVVSTLGRFGELSVTAIAEQGFMDRGQTSRTIDSLIAEGLVRLRPDVHDRRATLYSLSPEGEARYAAGIPVALERQKRLLEGFAPEEVEVLDRMLDRLIERLGERER